MEIFEQRRERGGARPAKRERQVGEPPELYPEAVFRGLGDDSMPDEASTAIGRGPQHLSGRRLCIRPRDDMASVMRAQEARHGVLEGAAVLPMLESEDVKRTHLCRGSAHPILAEQPSM